MGKCVSKGTLTQNGRAANQGQFSSCDEREWERICSNYRENNNLTGEEDAEVGYDLVCCPGQFFISFPKNFNN